MDVVPKEVVYSPQYPVPIGGILRLGSHRSYDPLGVCRNLTLPAGEKYFLFLQCWVGEDNMTTTFHSGYVEMFPGGTVVYENADFSVISGFAWRLA